jgi:hypothetical protein
MYAFILTACFTEIPQKQFPSEVTIISPSEEYRDQVENPYSVGSFIPFEFLIVDPDSDMNNIVVMLSSNIDGTLYQGSPDAEGNVSVLLASLSSGEHQISISAEDEQNYVTQSFSIGLNNPPPSPEVTILPENPTTSDDLYVDILVLDDEDGDDISYKIEWLFGGVLQEGESEIYLSSEFTTKDERWYVRVTPSDPYGEGEGASTSVIIGNAAPQFTSVSISPEEVYNDQTIECVTQVNDLDGDSIELSYRWELLSNGDTVDLGESSEILLARPNEISPNDRVYCYVTAEDDEQMVEEEAQVLISNRSPEITDLIILPASEIRAGTTLQCIGLGADFDGDAFDISYQWRAGEDDPTGALLGIGENLVLTTGNVVKGENVTCFVSIEDEHGAAITSTSSVEVENSPPYMDFVVLSPSNPTMNDDLFCYANATDIDTADTVTLDYQWMVNGVPIVNSTDTIPASSGAISYLDEVTCNVTPSDTVDNGESMSYTVQIENSVPQITSIELSPDPIYTDTMLTAIVETNDSDGHIVNLNYSWYVDGVLVKYGVYNNLEGELYFDKNQSIYVSVLASDNLDQVVAQSATISVQNSPPIAPVIELSEYSPSDEHLICEVVSPSTDLDGDEIDYQYEWWDSQQQLTSGLLSTNWIDDTVSSSFTVLDDQYICTVTASDGEDSVNASTETTIVACPLEYSFSIEEDLSNIYAPEPCWEIGKTETLPPSNFSQFITTGTSGEIEYFCLDDACVAHNPTTETVPYNYAHFPAGAVAFHPDTGPLLYSGFRWQAPTNGTCQVIFEFYGITSYATAHTDVNVYLYQEDIQQNSTLLDEVAVVGYQIPQVIDLSIPVLTGDFLYVVVEGDYTYDWLGVRGDIFCVF